jgi:hypothetical protein
VTISGSLMQSGGLETRAENQKHISKTGTGSQSNFKKHEDALLCCIHVGFGCNQPPARFNDTMQCREMQSGGLITGTESRKQTSKTQHNTKSVNKIEHKCTPVCCIHVSFGCNQQLALFIKITTYCSTMQSGQLATRTENQKRISKTQYKTK